MTTTIIPESICLDSSILISSLRSDETSSLIAFRNFVHKSCQRKPARVKAKISENNLMKSNSVQSEKLMKSNSNSAPVSVANTPDWHNRHHIKADKNRLNVLRGHCGNNRFSSNSSENSYVALNSHKRNVSGNHNRVSNNNSVAKSEDSKLKTCCFCWCCCYTFSCLNVNSSSEESSKHQISNDLTSRIETIIVEERLTVDLVKKWAESFDILLQCSAGHKIFREFLKSEYSEENILFYLACEDLKKEQVPDIVEEKARFIYEDYISILSPKEVSLDSRVREIINDNMVEPTTCTFDEAQLQIYTLMHRDSYPRFLNSKLYKDLQFKLEFDIQA